MRPLVLLFLLTLVLSCSQESALPKNSLLYREWNWIGYRNSDGSITYITPIAQSTLEFKPDGSFITRTARQVATCCVYTRFRLRNDQLILSDFKSENNCLSLCVLATREKAVTIKDVSETRLELDFGNQRNLYQAL